MIIRTPAEKIAALITRQALPLLQNYVRMKTMLPLLYDFNDKPIYTPHTIVGDTITWKRPQ